MLLFGNKNKILVTVATFWPMETPQIAPFWGCPQTHWFCCFFSLVVDENPYSSEYFRT